MSTDRTTYADPFLAAAAGHLDAPGPDQRQAIPVVRGPASGPFAIGDDRGAPVPEHIDDRTHRVPAIVRRTEVGGAPALMRAAEAIYLRVRAGMTTHPDSDRIATTPEELRRLVIDGVTVAALELHGEVTRLRSIAAEYADMLDPPGAPKCFEVKPEIVKAVAAAMRAGLAVK